jgi:hypothetical protein
VNPSKKLYPRPSGLAGYLDRAPQLRAGLQEVRAARRQENDLQSALPSNLRAATSAIRSTGQRLAITVTSAEAAHIVRLNSAQILRSCADKGLKFNEISVTVQSKPTSFRSPGRSEVPTLSTALFDRAEQIKSERLQTSLKSLLKTLQSNGKMR